MISALNWLFLTVQPATFKAQIFSLSTQSFSYDDPDDPDDDPDDPEVD